MGGIIGIQNHTNAAELTQVGLFSVQHRGQESCGIAVYDKNTNTFNFHRSSGLVMSGFPSGVLDKLQGQYAIGHVRYPTSGIKYGLQDAQPFVYKTVIGEVAIALSGNLINTEKLIKKVKDKGSLFQHSSGTELIIHMLAQEKGSLEICLKKTLPQLYGGFAAVLLAGDRLAAFRDPHGIRPLVLGKMGDTYIVASETSAIEVMGGEYIRDIKPAELLIIRNNKLVSSFYIKPKETRNCVFEQVYLSRPDSVIREHSVSDARAEMGKRLAQQMKNIKADIVMPIPDSGFFAALGFAKEAGLPFEMGLVRNHYMGRSFLKSSEKIREKAVRLKLLPVDDIIKGKDIVLVDDSLVRGTTAKKIVKLLRERGARKIHLALTSRPIIAPCFYGINTPSRKELIACTHTHKQILKEINADSVTFLTRKNVMEACGGKTGAKDYCDSCFTGKYITKISKETLAKR
jgi:amidophosphoribosyltransferase